MVKVDSLWHSGRVRISNYVHLVNTTLPHVYIIHVYQNVYRLPRASDVSRQKYLCQERRPVREPLQDVADHTD